MNAPAQRTNSQLILEGIVTTDNEDGSVNIAPMGPVADRSMQRLRFRPFSSSTTYKNLARSRRGVFHVTDDSEMLAAAAIGRLEPPRLHPHTASGGHILSDACRWYAFEVETLDDSQDRVEIECAITDTEQMRPFLGWNRAMHSVLEAAILATRVGLLGLNEVQRQMEPLQVIVDKTASDRERRAFQLILGYVNEQA